MSGDMLGAVVKKLVARPEMLGLVDDLLTKAENPDMLAAAKRCLRGQNPWPRTRRELLQACTDAGIPLFGGNAKSADCIGLQLPLFGDVPDLLYDFDETLRRQSAGEFPFNSTYDQMNGPEDRLLSVEQTLMIILTWFRRTKKMPGKAIWLLCCNDDDSDGQLFVGWSPRSGLVVYHFSRDTHDADLGGLIKK